jgi:hypothetical protein
MQIFSADDQGRSPNWSETFASDFKEKFPRFEICPVSATIDIDRSIFDIRRNEPRSAKRRKNTVSAIGTIHVRS